MQSVCCFLVLLASFPFRGGVVEEPRASASSPAPAIAGLERYHGFAPIGDTRLFYEVAGAGDALVLIHGGQLDSRMWDGEFELLAARQRVLRYDVRGFGGSPREDAPYSDHGDLVALLDYLGIERAHLVGLSLGGRIAVDVALAHPERVSSLVLVGAGLSGFDFADPEGDERMWAVIQAMRRGDTERGISLWLSDPLMAPAMEQPGLAARLTLLARENAHAWIANPYRTRPLEPRAVGRLAEIRAPTLVVVGTRDTAPIKAVAAKLSAEIAGAQDVVVEGAGHMVNMERPVEFAAALTAFLDGLER